MASKRTKLGPELKRLLTERRQSMSQAAKQLSLYENSLRSWIRRNTFPAEALVKIASFAGLPKKLEALEQDYEFHLAGAKRTRGQRINELLDRDKLELGEVLEALDSDLPQDVPTIRDQAQVLRLLFRALSKDEVYVHFALDEFPYEMESGWTFLGKEIAGAVRRGAQILYIYPGPEVVTHTQACGIHRVPEPGAHERAFKAFQERLVHADAKLSAIDVRARTHTQCVDGHLFLAPGHHYLLFRNQSDASVRPRLFSLIPVVSRTGKTTVQLTLADDACGMFMAYVSALLTRSQHAGLARLLS